jgi:hypothetical protein
MTETVVVEKANTVVQEQKPQTVVTQTTSIQTIVTGLMGPPGITALSNATDIDKTQLTDGAVLVYAANTATWRATTKLDNQILEAGQF